MTEKIIKFVRRRDLQFIRELGAGACGKTVLLYDDIIDEYFVCKKYSPITDSLKYKLFNNFIQEIKLLHLINHPNIVRVFNYFLYPEQYTGYILMENVNGTDIEDFLKHHPENTSIVFKQLISGFNHLEQLNILHRDIRPQNILVNDQGIVKIIDFGFGKKIASRQDFDKSISLNWWCPPPRDFEQYVYDFRTEIYFIGRLFEKILEEVQIEEFSYKSILKRMCATDPQERIKSFASIEQEIFSEQFSEIEFTDYELEIYRNFAIAVFGAISKIENGTKFIYDPDAVIRNLELSHRKVMLEEVVPNTNLVLRCLLDGAYYYKKQYNIEVTVLKEFLDFLRGCTKEKRNIVISNLYTKLDNITRYDINSELDDEIPF
ncbi:protein kinase family protein [Ferruginivarius sediminum]|uniref:protein kinase family protein n=1 Tax=Ferruginivarius sediminum TaxID=2661937 RepID=UPI0013798EB2|nr:protein kinase family protein [Ferruginivarius sediminum]